MKTHLLIATATLVLSTSSCTTYSFGHRDRNCNPDERLESLVAAYDACKGGSAEDDGRLIVDCDREWNAIERLSIEFPEHAPSLMANAVIAYDERSPQKSQRYLDALLAIESSYPEAAILRSRVAMDEGNLQLARRVLDMQVAYTPNHAGVREALSSVLYMSRDLEGAGTQLALAEKLGAPAWRVAFNRGLIAEAAGRPADAQRLYRAAVDGNPDFTPAQDRLNRENAGSGYNQTKSPTGKTGGG